MPFHRKAEKKVGISEPSARPRAFVSHVSCDGNLKRLQLGADCRPSVRASLRFLNWHMCMSWLLPIQPAADNSDLSSNVVALLERSLLASARSNATSIVKIVDGGYHAARYKAHMLSKESKFLRLCCLYTWTDALQSNDAGLEDSSNNLD